MKRVSILLTLFALSVGIAYAEGNTTHQNFDSMYRAGTMTVNTSTKVATTDFVTYTYSGGTYSRFNYDSSITNNKICLQLYGSGAQVVTTAVESLDSLMVYYYPENVRNQRIKVSTSDDGGSSWTKQDAVQDVDGLKTYKFPSTGDYMLKIERVDNIWLEQIDYITAPPCNCLRVVVSE